MSTKTRYEFTCTGQCGLAGVAVEGGVCLGCLDQHDPNQPHVQRESCSDLCRVILDAAQRGLNALYFRVAFIPELGNGAVIHQRHLSQVSFDGGKLVEDVPFRHLQAFCPVGCPFHGVKD